jgi:outer membrane protein assembly factor BamD (BamD/ComL family)
MTSTLESPRMSKKPAAPALSAQVDETPGWAAFLSSRRAQYAALGIVAVVAIGWFVALSSRRKEEFAARALDQARAAAEAGNLPLAASELQKVTSTYGGTDAAQEAVITLNQVRLVNGQNELAVVGLQDFLKSAPAVKYRAASYGLLGRALENAKRPAEAAEAFENASKTADVDYLRADYLLEAGRAWRNSGSTDKATEAYRRIITSYPKTTSKVEAEVRLAELTGGKL